MNGSAGTARICGRGAVAACLLSLLLIAPAAEAEEESRSTAPAAVGEAPILSVPALEYRPGRGLRLEPAGLVIGGFTNIKGERDRESGGEFTVDSLNFFLIFDRFERFRTVAELQLKDIFVADDEQAGVHDFAFDVRRLFGEFTVSDELRLRAGTFLTPVGYWNLLLAPPLTWTTEPPLIVEEVFFQQTTTGLQLHGSTGIGDGQLGYSLFSQFLDPIQDDPELDPPDFTIGGRVDYRIGSAWSFGASYQAADVKHTPCEPDEDEPGDPDGEEPDPDGEGGLPEPGGDGDVCPRLGEWTHTGGLHLLWQHRRGEILTEALVQDGNALESSRWGAYLQGVVEVYEPFFLVGRYEHFDAFDSEPPLNIFSLGGAYKPFPFMALKVEYRLTDRTSEEDDPAGFFSSFTTFF